MIYVPGETWRAKKCPCAAACKIMSLFLADLPSSFIVDLRHWTFAVNTTTELKRQSPLSRIQIHDRLPIVVNSSVFHILTGTAFVAKARSQVCYLTERCHNRQKHPALIIANRFHGDNKCAALQDHMRAKTKSGESDVSKMRHHLCRENMACHLVCSHHEGESFCKTNDRFWW